LAEDAKRIHGVIAAVDIECKVRAKGILTLRGRFIGAKRCVSSRFHAHIAKITASAEQVDRNITCRAISADQTGTVTTNLTCLRADCAGIDIDTATENTAARKIERDVASRGRAVLLLAFAALRAGIDID